MVDIRFQIVISVVTAVIALASLVRAFLSLRVDRQQRTDFWLRAFQELHATFWGDPDFAEVRMWLSSDLEYEKSAKRSLVVRKMGGRLLAEEYIALEKLDKFLNLLQKALAIHRKLSQPELWQLLFFGFWLKRLAFSRHPELVDYVRRFYGDLYNHRYELTSQHGTRYQRGRW